MLVLGRRKKVWGDARTGVRENDEEVVIGPDIARAYLLGTTLRGDRVWDSTTQRSRIATTDTVRVGIDLSEGSKLTRWSPVEDYCFATDYPQGVRRLEVELCTDEALYLDHQSFGSDGVMLVVARIVHATHVRFGFEADWSVRIHRLEVLRRIAQQSADRGCRVVPMEGSNA